jgi:hypothetical protein
MNRRQLLKGLICAPIAGVTVAESLRESPEIGFSLVQPKAEGSTVPYDDGMNELRIYPGTGGHYARIAHDGTDLIIENTTTGRVLRI